LFFHGNCPVILQRARSRHVTQTVWLAARALLPLWTTATHIPSRPEAKRCCGATRPVLHHSSHPVAMLAVVGYAVLQTTSRLRCASRAL
jgi:hypothetical protein